VIDEEIKKRNSPGQEAGSLSSRGSSTNDSNSGGGYSFVNIVFNYFNEASPDDQVSNEQIQKLEHKQEQLK